MLSISIIILLAVVALNIGLIAVVYSVILTDPGMILYSLYAKLEAKLPEWLFKPLIGCSLCVAGQMALWIFMGVYTFSGVELHILIFTHAAFVSASIFSAKMFLYLNNKISQ